MYDDPILQAFALRLAHLPDEPLLLARELSRTTAEVDLLSRQLQRRLVKERLGTQRNPRGRLAALAAPNGSAFVAGFLALRRLGMPVLLLDWRTPESEKQRITEHLGASFLLRCQAPWATDAAEFEILDVATEDEAVLEQDIAVVKLTSGSTGMPRGILTPAAALVADDAQLSEAMQLHDDERILAAVPMSHSYGLSSILMPALMREAILIVPEAGKALSPLRLASQHEATFFPTVPTYLQSLLKMSNPPELAPSVRLVITAGAPLRAETAKSFREVYGRSVHVFYGASEAGGISFDVDGTAGERGTLGKLIHGVKVELEPTAESTGKAEEVERGSITIVSSAASRGYLPADPDVLQQGRFRTQDLGSLVDGELILHGRLDRMIKIKGKKVDPREVDEVLGRLPGVEEVITLGIVPEGRTEPIVRSWVACPPDTLSYAQVQRWCREHLTEHKVPRSILLVESIPRTARGKLDRRALLALEDPDIPN